MKPSAHRAALKTVMPASLKPWRMNAILPIQTVFTRKMSRPVLFALALFVALASQVHAAEPRPLVFGVLNQQSPVLTAERWNPILQYLSQVTGIPLHLRMGRTVQETDAMMGRGEFDLAYTNHNFQTEFDGVYKVIARWGGDPIRCVIVVPAGSRSQV